MVKVLTEGRPNLSAALGRLAELSFRCAEPAFGLAGRARGLAERHRAWPNHPMRSRSILPGGTWLPRHNPFVVLFAGAFWPKYEAGEVRADV